ncbi:MAG: vWA domain-containing protein [Acidobacteriota bacterium]
MRSIRYSKFTEEDFGLTAEDLMKALADFFLQSGFEDPYGQFPFDENSLEALREAVRRALLSGELAPLEEIQKLSEEQFEALVDRLVEKLQTEGYVTEPPPGPGREGEQQEIRVEATDKALDFLGYKTLKDLMGSLGKASLGAHDTRELSTGVETSGSSKLYEFGDTLNLDVNTTLFHAMRREGVQVPRALEAEARPVPQSEYQSSCATVLMLDCSHSMILYGEDRFTPAKRVALALAHLIRTQYPGDTLRCVLFHDSAEELRLQDLARVQVGPYYTNTRDGLILAQKLLQQEKKDMKQIIMITDGKPSALTLDDGQIYKNPFGLDPLVISRTLEEVSRCKRAGILINTFMLAQDYGLMSFVKKVSELCRGKAYFTSPYTLGQYLLMDYMTRKSKMVH